MKRRQFLDTMLAAPLWCSMLTSAWSAQVPGGREKRLVVVLLRGAVDGLNVLVPYTDGHYYDYRPGIAIREGSSADRARDLDGRFALHPALAAIMPLWRDRSLAFVQCCGSPDNTRSHFEAQAYMESGTPGVRTTADGWMNRLLSVLPGEKDATRAVSFGPVLPRIIKGKAPATNVAVGKAATHAMPLDRPVVSAAFDRLYRGDDALARAYREGQKGRRTVMAELAADMEGSSMGAPGIRSFDNTARRVARLIARDGGTQLAVVELGGWDTHVNQGSGAGQLANRLKPLGDGLMALIRALGHTYKETVIVVMSEFGRTVRENGNGGTDHGHGNAMWVMGGSVRGEKFTAIVHAWRRISYSKAATCR